MSGGGNFTTEVKPVGEVNQAMPQGARMGDPVMQPGVPNANYANSAMPRLGAASLTPTAQPSVYQPQYQQYQPQPRVPQYQQQVPNYQSGLQAAMMQMMQQYSRPIMRAPLQQGIPPSSPLTYRPPAVNNLSRVAPSVELQQRLAAEEAARKAAEEAANAPPPTYDYGGGG
jgi:hypothetical protein